MSIISEQVKNVRDCVKKWQTFENIPSSEPFKLLSEAADTIEALSAKLAAVNAERNEILKGIRKKAQELSNQHWGDDERHLIVKGIQCMCVQAENIIGTYEDSAANIERSDRYCGGGWIACEDRLPEENGWYLVYAKNQRPFVDYFKGKTFPLNNHYHEIVAWMSLPEPYRP